MPTKLSPEMEQKASRVMLETVDIYSEFHMTGLDREFDNQ